MHKRFKENIATIKLHKIKLSSHSSKFFPRVIDFQSETKTESFGFVEVRKAKLQYLILAGSALQFLASSVSVSWRSATSASAMVHHSAFPQSWMPVLNKNGPVSHWEAIFDFVKTFFFNLFASEIGVSYGNV